MAHCRSSCVPVVTTGDSTNAGAERRISSGGSSRFKLNFKRHGTLAALRDRAPRSRTICKSHPRFFRQFCQFATEIARRGATSSVVVIALLGCSQRARPGRALRRCRPRHCSHHRSLSHEHPQPPPHEQPSPRARHTSQVTLEDRFHCRHAVAAPATYQRWYTTARDSL